MAIRATGGFNLVRYEPGNPEFPTLPDGVIVPHLITYAGGGGLRARAPIKSGRVLGSAPADDEQRYAGWQTETTWVNPTVVDFGVIPSPVQRTISLYNARTTPVEVTALPLPTGVTLVSPALPGTLNPYAGVTFTLEAGITGADTFDEFVTFTTSEGPVTFRIIGRRVFNLENIPQAPMMETLHWRTDLIRSTDGSEKAYGLLNAPNIAVDYKIKFTNDIQRIKFKNNFIAGESALVVSGQKWYEARRLKNAAGSADTTLDVDTQVFNASWKIGGPIAVVTEAGTSYSAQLDSWQYQPDPYYESNVLLLRFNGAHGSTEATDLSPLARAVTFNSGPIISTAQSKFGGSSLQLGTSQTDGVQVAYDPAIEFLGDDFTIEMWVRPHPNDLTSDRMLISRWHTAAGPGREWYLLMGGSYIQFRTWVPNQTRTFNFSSPSEVQADTWHHIAVCRSGDDLRCFVDGVQIGTTGSITGSVGTVVTGSPELTTRIGAYYDSGFRNPYDGYIDDIRITKVARYTTDFTPPTAQHPDINDTFLELTLGAALGADVAAGSFVMPSGLGYVSAFPGYLTHRENLEEADYQLTFNKEQDWSELDTTYFPTLVDLQSPQNTLPVLDFCNEIKGKAKGSQMQRAEHVLDSGLSNRLAFSEYPFADHVSDFQITLYSEDDVWTWRKFLHYLRGSYGEFFVPTFTDDMPGVTTAASNVFNITDQDLHLLFGDPPDPRRNAIRLKYPNGNVYYRMITQVVDNVATEEVTVDSAVEAGNPTISYLQRCRILGDTVTFEHRRTDYVVLRFRFRTILL